MLSNTRTNVPATTGDLKTDEVVNFPIWEVFTQKNVDDIHVHAGSLSAPDASFAQQFAREHYGQDQICINIWVGRHDSFVSDAGESDTYDVFVQWEAGARHEHVGAVEAENGKQAKEHCRKQFVGDKSYYTIWTCPSTDLTKIDGETNMIWRETTDQSYRLARGYSKVVRKKWDALRAGQAVDRYQEEDLKETF